MINPGILMPVYLIIICKHKKGNENFGFGHCLSLYSVYKYSLYCWLL